MLDKSYYVYIMTNKRNSVLYIGVTNDLARRTIEHKDGKGSAFCKKYNISKLVYFEKYNDISIAIEREKQLKNYSRKRKDQLIDKNNFERKDFFNEIWDW